MQEPLKDPTSYTLLTYLWVFAISGLGGAVSFSRKVKAGQSHWSNIAAFLGEIATSAFVGLITFFLCESAKLAPLLTAALVGICAHMGSRAIYQFETIILRRRLHLFTDEAPIEHDDAKK